MEININKENFENEVLKADKLVLVDFWATWCGPCQMLGPVVENIAKERQDVKVCKVNVDNEQGLAIEYGIMGVPTIIFFKNGKQVKISVGLLSKSELEEIIDSL